MKISPGKRWLLQYREPKEFYSYCFRRDGILGTAQQNLQLAVFSLLGAGLFLTPSLIPLWNSSKIFDLMSLLLRVAAIIFVGFGIMFNTMRYMRTVTGGSFHFYEGGMKWGKHVMPFRTWQCARLHTLKSEGLVMTMIVLTKLRNHFWYSSPTEIGVSAEENLVPLLELFRIHGISIRDERDEI